MKPDVVNKLVLTSFILGLVAATPARAATFPTTGRTTVAGQAKVTFLLPEQPVAPAVVLVPGAGLSSSIYLGTPDGREGWAQYFARHGHPVYAVDLPDRSSAFFQARQDSQ